MAAWLSSRLKQAEQLLQQIDQQAAVSLQKLDKDNANQVSPDAPKGDGHAIHDQRHSNSTRPESLNLPSQAGNGKSRHAKPTHLPPGTRRSNEDGQRPSKQDDFGKQDWTELLGAVEFTPPVSAARSFSSVGSTDFGASQSANKGGAQRGLQHAGKGPVSTHQTDGSTPASRMVPGGAGPPYPASAQASRTKGANSHMVDFISSEFHPSEFHQKAEHIQEDENTPRRLEFGSQAAEGIGEHDTTAEQPLDTFSHTSDLGTKTDSFVQQAEQDGEFTELELSVPGETEALQDQNIGDIARGSFVEHAPHPISDLVSPLPPTVFVDDKDVEGPQTGVDIDAGSLGDEKEELTIDDQAGVNTIEEGGAQEDFLDSHDNIEEAEVPKHTVTVQEGNDKQVGDDASIEDSEGSVLSESEEESRSGSETESDSEYEERVRRRRERRKELAEQRAARAAAAEAARVAIQDREEFVTKLEQEKESLEKLLAEWEERQAKEAEELNLTMKEVTEAVDVEKQHHAVTRRDGLAREAQLEAKNQELAKALASAERNLEDESARVALARSKVEAREIVQSDLQRKIASLEHRLRPPSQPQESRDGKSERESAEEHYAELAARLESYQNKAKELEEKIFIARDAHYTPSVMELELEGRLNQLTDHLIQKQAQVESLSTEKATLYFRLEAISNTLREEKSVAQSRASKRSKGVNAGTDWSTYDEDLEYGLSKPYSSKDKIFFMGTDPDMILNQTSGARPWMRLARQVDSLFLGGARILRTSGSARAFAALYLFLLHSWVLFILFMHMRSGSSGAGSEGTVQAGVNTLSSLTHSLNATTFNQM